MAFIARSLVPDLSVQRAKTPKPTAVLECSIFSYLLFIEKCIPSYYGSGSENCRIPIPMLHRANIRHVHIIEGLECESGTEGCRTNFIWNKRTFSPVKPVWIEQRHDIM